MAWDSNPRGADTRRALLAYRPHFLPAEASSRCGDPWAAIVPVFRAASTVPPPPSGGDCSTVTEAPPITLERAREILGAFKGFRAGNERLREAQKRRPLDHAQREKGVPHLGFGRLSFQEVVYQLALHGTCRSDYYGIDLKPEKQPREFVLVGPNRGGKTETGAQVMMAHAEGRGRLWPKGKSDQLLVVAGDSLATVTRIIRKKLRGWETRQGAGPQTSVLSWTPRENSDLTKQENEFRTHAGWHGLLKSYDQEPIRFKGFSAQGIWLDEQPRKDAIASECRARLIDSGGWLLHTFTGQEGTHTDLFRRAYEPWLEVVDTLKAARKPIGECPVCGYVEYGAMWAEVEPGTWVVTSGMRDNAVSRGGYLKDEFIDDYEQNLIAQGKELEARMRVHGEWLDISSESIIPVELWREWEDEPKGGFLSKTAWIDTAAGANQQACRTSIAVAGRARDGKAHLIASEGGRWQPHEKIGRLIEVLQAHGCPPCYVQRTTPDMLFRDHLNAELMRRSLRACCGVWPPKGKGSVPGKVPRAQAFAPMVASGQVLARREHLAGEMGNQARKFSIAYEKSKGLCDDIDAAMGALMLCVEQAGVGGAPANVFNQQFVRHPTDHEGDRDDDVTWADRMDGDAPPWGTADIADLGAMD